MIIDTSAAVAILRHEPTADDLRRHIEGTDMLRMSACSVLELTMVIGRVDPDLVDLFIEKLGIQVLPVDLEQLKWARHAFAQFGRGSGSPAKLNFGDCLTYAAAKTMNESLLFVGEDFSHTDLDLAE